MAVPFVSRKRLNPRDLEAEGKFYPAPAYIAEIGVNQLAEEISSSTTLTPTEVIGVIPNLRRFMRIYWAFWKISS